MRNKKISNLLEKMKGDNNAENHDSAIVNLSEQMARHLIGGKQEPNSGCANWGCSSGSNSSCSNTLCGGDLLSNNSCSNSACV
jgi:hypothetical protein